MFCTQCGAPNDVNSYKCIKCGTVLCHEPAVTAATPNTPSASPDLKPTSQAAPAPSAKITPNVVALVAGGVVIIVLLIFAAQANRPRSPAVSNVTAVQKAPDLDPLGPKENEKRQCTDKITSIKDRIRRIESDLKKDNEDSETAFIVNRRFGELGPIGQYQSNDSNGRLCVLVANAEGMRKRGIPGIVHVRVQSLGEDKVKMTDGHEEFCEYYKVLPEIDAPKLQAELPLRQQELSKEEDKLRWIEADLAELKDPAVPPLRQKLKTLETALPPLLDNVPIVLQRRFTVKPAGDRSQFLELINGFDKFDREHRSQVNALSQRFGDMQKELAEITTAGQKHPRLVAGAQVLSERIKEVLPDLDRGRTDQSSVCVYHRELIEKLPPKLDSLSILCGALDAIDAARAKDPDKWLQPAIAEGYSGLCKSSLDALAIMPTQLEQLSDADLKSLIKFLSQVQSQQLLDDAAWQLACRKAEFSEWKGRLEAYLSGNTLRKHEMEGNAILKQVNTQADDAAWDVASKPGEPAQQLARMAAYLAGTTIKAHRSEAEALAERIRDDQAWSAAEKPGNPEEWIPRLDAYLAMNTYKLHRDEATALRTKQVQTIDDKAWEVASKFGEPEEWLRRLAAYLSGQTSKSHKAECQAHSAIQLSKLTNPLKEQLASLQRKEDLNGQTSMALIKLLRWVYAEDPDVKRVSGIVLLPPKWASAYGLDRYGYWAELRVPVSRDATETVAQRLRFCPPGRFNMGHPQIRRNHLEVLMPTCFWMAETECTQQLWQAVMGTNPSQVKGDQLPVTNVSVANCATFFTRLNSLIPGVQAGLPTCARWQYAAMAGTDGLYEHAKGMIASQGRVHQVGTTQPNPWGLYEMLSNVSELALDGFSSFDKAGPVTDPVGETDGTTALGCGRDVFQRQSMNSGAYLNTIGFRMQVLSGSETLPSATGSTSSATQPNSDRKSDSSKKKAEDALKKVRDIFGQ